MSITFHENLAFSETNISYEDVSTVGRSGGPAAAAAANSFSPKTEDIHLFAEKLRVPTVNNITSRPRLNSLLTKFSEQVGATLATGRAGTGKTTLAAEFASNYERVAWYGVESADSDWSIFSSYFAESFKRAGLLNDDAAGRADAAADTLVSPFIENLFSRANDGDDGGGGGSNLTKKPVLIVLDDVHYIFDAPWFADFFGSLLYSLDPATHLLMLSRSSPDFPLWRLRSKQVLGVLDEELLFFNDAEAAEFLAGYGLDAQTAQEIYKKSFGRIAKLKSLAEAAAAAAAAAASSENRSG